MERFQKNWMHMVLHRAMVRLACASLECGTGLVRRLASVLCTHSKGVSWSLASVLTRVKCVMRMQACVLQLQTNRSLVMRLAGWYCEREARVGWCALHGSTAGICLTKLSLIHHDNIESTSKLL